MKNYYKEISISLNVTKMWGGIVDIAKCNEAIESNFTGYQVHL